MKELNELRFTSDTDANYAARIVFLRNLPDDCHTLIHTLKYTMRRSIADIALEIAGFMGHGAVVKAVHNTSIFITKDQVQVWLYGDQPSRRGYPGKNRKTVADKDVIQFEVEISGEAEAATKLSELIASKYHSERLATINWVYTGDSGLQWHAVYTDKPAEAKSAFYPWIKRGVDKYLSDYLESDASTLLLMGPPGTGKTSLLRHMIFQHAMRAVITYDQLVLGRDNMFYDFMMGEHDLLLIEDADEMLTSRKHAGNQAMARILNISDGVIKLPNKKIVFTTNLESTAEIDQALVRPGRCFDVMKFRALTPEEAVIAASVAGLPPREFKREVTLGELFNPDAAPPAPRKVGFAA